MNLYNWFAHVLWKLKLPKQSSSVSIFWENNPLIFQNKHAALIEEGGGVILRDSDENIYSTGHSYRY